MWGVTQTSIKIQNLLENENLLFRKKDKRNIQYNADVNNNDKSNCPSDEIFISCSQTFMMSENTRNDKETNNVKLTNYVQALATTNDIEGTIDEVTNTIFHQPASYETYTPHIIAGQSV